MTTIEELVHAKGDAVKAICDALERLNVSAAQRAAFNATIDEVAGALQDADDDSGQLMGLGLFVDCLGFTL